MAEATERRARLWAKYGRPDTVDAAEALKVLSITDVTPDKVTAFRYRDREAADAYASANLELHGLAVLGTYELPAGGVVGVLDLRPELARMDALRANGIRRPAMPGFVYLASSWKNPIYDVLSAVLTAAGIDHYNFRNPPNGAGFGWEQLPEFPVIDGSADRDTYRKMLEHPIAAAGFEADFSAMEKADTFVLVLPCGKSAHLELGWAVGAGKRTAILLEDPIQPELMYRMVDHLSPSVHELLGWLGVED